MNLFWDEVLNLGGIVVGAEPYDPKQTDFSDPIKKLGGLYYEIPEDLNANPGRYKSRRKSAVGTDDDEPVPPIVDFEAIFIPDSSKKAGLIIPQLAYHDIKNVYLLGTNLWHSDSLIKIAEKYVQGAIMPDGFFAESSSSEVRKFVELFETTYQEKPAFFEAIVYDSTMILLHVLGQPHIRFRSEIRDELLNLYNFQGVTGLTRFDETGEVQRKLHLLQIRGKRFVELE
jgi:ABC-type branched-subunit amino acid transport system substrate-binding protein